MVSLSSKRDATTKDLLHRRIDWSIVKHPLAHKWTIILLLSVVLSLILSHRLPSYTYRHYLPSEIASQDVKAPQDCLVEDIPSTLSKQTKAAENVRAVYDFDLDILGSIERKLDNAFKVMSQGGGEADKTLLTNDAPAKENPAQLIGVEISGAALSVLKKKNFDPNILTYIYRILDTIFEQGVVGNRELLMSETDRGIVVTFFPTREETVIQDFSRFMDLAQARSRVKKEARLLIPSSERSLEKPVVEIADGLLRPNITFNKSETEERKIAAREAVKPVLFEIKKGEIIIREGEKVTAEHLLKLAKLRQLKSDQNPTVYRLGTMLMVFLILSIAFNFSGTEGLRNPQVKNKDLFFVGLMMILLTIMIRMGDVAPETNLRFLSERSIFFALPIAAGAIVVSVVLGLKQCLIFSVVISILSIMVLDYKIEYFLYPFIGSLIGAREAVYCNQRSTLLKAGLWVGLANILVILCLRVKLGDTPPIETLVGDAAMGFLSGILSGIIAAGFVPLIEVVFSYTTDIKLLELGNLNHPLLKDLILNAPGTYHHSIVTGSLVEAAAEAIGANQLLARVGAYYHDIGKMKTPLYFIENQEGVENRHDKLSPNMSSLILLSHVKEGIEKAREYKLGKVISDIIQQHHGTNLINYFYQKAKGKENPSEAFVDEKDFRYPGPKPQNKEAALVMLGDAVEASSRILTDPTPARIQGLVQRTINNFFTDGQLDECELTLKDLHLIAKSFTRVLIGVFHHRIKYPGKSSVYSSLHKYKQHETLDQEFPKEGKNRLKNGEANRERDLRRLGMS